MNHVNSINQTVSGLLATFQHPTLQKNLVAIKALSRCELVDGTLYLSLKMPFVWDSVFAQLQATLEAKLLAIPEVKQVKWSISYEVATLKQANNQSLLKNVKNIIAVSSGKGGVGKSSTAVNLALALAKEGGKVGLLDADIYGPSIPTMLGTKNEQPLSPDNKHMSPIMAHGLATSSIGYLVAQDGAMVWRGPMASKALLQILQDTLWPELDYMVIDMPPGTGDIQLTLAQNIPVTASVIVTTPQDIALVDARKGLTMFKQVNIPTLGVIENMSYHICENCGHHEAIFGEGGARQLAEQYHTQLLGQIPLHRSLRQDLDNGTPTVINQPDSEFTRYYCEIADSVAAALYWQGEVVPSAISFKQV
ncbi:iron-sulfur cluster carrier protein ApbC [Zophobihabitans entericus]|uniref:Iron-sulfur cluster carrier protein n=1 Tax=Zophobihabitans entericus TaxID=1635327 RepID=A0A6G9IDJ6_9GAMM|nr:iron-sulfur cluster carrier protein ApbC [Zophobihabitans entericus]QIQ22311.1 iron-sulfur cluster carrier protein ApbC [Zophobihabitans entericus]